MTALFRLLLGLALLASPGASPAQQGTPAKSPEEMRKQNALRLVWKDGDANPDGSPGRRKFRAEFMTESEGFLKQFPDNQAIWILRAMAAVELDDSRAGWEAGRKLIAFGLDKSESELIQQVFAQLERRKWLGDKPAGLLGATEAAPFVNSLGLKFVPVPGTDVLFCIWETRVQDFAAFVNATGHDATQGMYSLREDGGKQRGDTWKSPGFTQGPTHPVCGVNWEDAKAFCAWLTEKERRAGKISSGQEYRLPSDAEWSWAVGIGDKEGTGAPKDKSGKLEGTFPWGTAWPPPSGSGNYAGEESKVGAPSSWKVIDGYNDGYARTAPGGSFAANRLGIYDLGGNVWEWCEDWYDREQKYRVLRGGSWGNDNQVSLLSSLRDLITSDVRNSYLGFRVVLVGGSSR